MALLRHWQHWRKQRKSRQCGSKAECQRTGLQITEEFRREFGSTLKPVRRLRFRGTYRARSRWFHPSDLPWMWQNESRQGDRSQDRFRVEMEICGDPVSARAFPQALTHPRKSFRSLSICLAVASRSCLYASLSTLSSDFWKCHFCTDSWASATVGKRSIRCPVDAWSAIGLLGNLDATKHNSYS